MKLAAGASLLRKKDGRILTDPQALIAYGKYGVEKRNIDPHIGAEVNRIVRESKALVAITNPVGLFLGDFNPTGWQMPSDVDPDPKKLWTITRGTQEKAVRAVFKFPEGCPYTVSDIKINGVPINYASQIADFIHFKFTGLETHI